MAPNEDLPRRGKVAWPEEPIIDGSLRTMPRNDYLREFGPVIDHLGLGNGAWFNPVINGQAFSFESRALPPSLLSAPYTQLTLVEDRFPESWLFQVSTVAPGLGQPGGALQVQVFSPKRRPVTMAELLELKVARR